MILPHGAVILNRLSLLSISVLVSASTIRIRHCVELVFGVIHNNSLVPCLVFIVSLFTSFCWLLSRVQLNPPLVDSSIKTCAALVVEYATFCCVDMEYSSPPLGVITLAL